jgi:ABC-type nitrate/sulfonate/bicarbonate transport system substrate-binding protein
MKQLDGNLTRRQLLGSLVGLAAVSALAACGGGATAPASSAAAPSAPASKPAAASAPASAKPAASTAASAKSAASGAASAKPAASAASSAQASAGASGARKDVVKLGVLTSASDAGFYIGFAKGWYADQGLDIQTTQFASAAQMIAPLSQGQLDAGGGATSAGLDNAIARDIGIKMVADKAFVPTDSSYQAIVVRKDLADKVKDYKDLKGMKFALSGEAISPMVAVDRAMRKSGLTIKDVDLTYLGFPDMAAAMAGKQIDAAHPIEPFTTQIPAQGSGVIFKRSYEYSPNDQIAVVLYSPGLIKDRPDVAKRFMVAYLRSVRLYNDAFFKKAKDQAAHDEVVDILSKATTVKDKALYEKMEMPSLHPDGKLVLNSVKEDQDWYIEHGYQKTKIDIDAGVDMSYADVAVQQLGAYKA